MLIKFQLLICAFIQGYLGVYIWKIVLTEKYNLRITCLISALTSTFCSSLDFILFPKLSIKTVLAATLTFLIVLLLFKDKVSRKIICFFVWIAFSFLFDIVAYVVSYYLFGLAPTMADPFNEDRLKTIIVGTVIYLIIFSFVKSYLRTRKKLPNGSVTSSLMTSIIIGQSFLIWACIIVFFSGEIYASILLMTIAIVFAIISNFISFRSIQQALMKNSIDRRCKLEEEEFKQQILAYKQVLQKKKELSKLQHDIAGHLCTMQMLAQENNEAALLKYIKDLQLD